jgi:hypothetical protein
VENGNIEEDKREEDKREEEDFPSPASLPFTLWVRGSAEEL